MKQDERTWEKCSYCKGEGATYEEDPKHEGYYFQYLCQECNGSGGRWQHEHARDA